MGGMSWGALGFVAGGGTWWTGGDPKIGLQSASPLFGLAESFAGYGSQRRKLWSSGSVSGSRLLWGVWHQAAPAPAPKAYSGTTLAA